MSIYEIFHLMGYVFKYTGFVALPGLYEKPNQSKFKKILIDYGLPLHFAAVNTVLLLVSKILDCRTITVNEMLGQMSMLVSILVTSKMLMVLLFFSLFLSTPMVKYLKGHESIDELLRPEKHLIRRHVNVIFVSCTLLAVLNTGVTGAEALCANTPAKLIIKYTGISIGLIYFSSHFSQPHCVYITFQYILRRAFDQLLKEIQRETSLRSPMDRQKDANREIKRIRRLSRHYVNICKLCKRLDEMMAIFMLLEFLLSYLVTALQSALITSAWNMTNTKLYIYIFSIVFVIMALTPNYAEETEKSASKVIAAMFSLSNFDEPRLKTEMNAFCLKCMYFKPSFSAFGMFRINRALTLNLINSIIPYVVIFYKMDRKIE